MCSRFLVPSQLACVRVAAVVTSPDVACAVSGFSSVLEVTGAVAGCPGQFGTVAVTQVLSRDMEGLFLRMFVIM